MAAVLFIPITRLPPSFSQRKILTRCVPHSTRLSLSCGSVNLSTTPRNRPTLIPPSNTTNIQDQLTAPPRHVPTDVTTRVEYNSLAGHIISHFLNCAALFSILTLGAQPTYAEEVSASTTVSGPLSFIKSLQGNPTFDRFLGITVLVLLIYATIGAIIVSIDGIIVRRNDEREKEWVRKRVEGKPYPKTMWSLEIDTEFPPRSPSDESSPSGLNREQRRIEKKLQLKEEKEKKRREARAASKKKGDEGK